MSKVSFRYLAPFRECHRVPGDEGRCYASEVPLYKTATLVEYINWVKQNVPAENYIFMPMNHGGGLDLSEEVTCPTSQQSASPFLK